MHEDRIDGVLPVYGNRHTKAPDTEMPAELGPTTGHGIGVLETGNARSDAVGNSRSSRRLQTRRPVISLTTVHPTDFEGRAQAADGPRTIEPPYGSVRTTPSPRTRPIDAIVP